MRENWNAEVDTRLVDGKHLWLARHEALHRRVDLDSSRSAVLDHVTQVRGPGITAQHRRINGYEHGEVAAPGRCVTRPTIRGHEVLCLHRDAGGAQCVIEKRHCKEI